MAQFKQLGSGGFNGQDVVLDTVEVISRVEDGAEGVIGSDPLQCNRNGPILLDAVVDNQVQSSGIGNHMQNITQCAVAGLNVDQTCFGRRNIVTDRLIVGSGERGGRGMSLEFADVLLDKGILRTGWRRHRYVSSRTGGYLRRIGAARNAKSERESGKNGRKLSDG